MVMMFFTGHFVARRVAMCFGRLQPSFLNQRLDIWVLPDAWRRASPSFVLSLGFVGFSLILCLTRLLDSLGYPNVPAPLARSTQSTVGTLRWCVQAKPRFQTCDCWNRDSAIWRKTRNSPGYQKVYGPEKVVESWCSTGLPLTTPK